jgi:phospholipase D1/2
VQNEASFGVFKKVLLLALFILAGYALFQFTSLSLWINKEKLGALGLVLWNAPLGPVALSLGIALGLCLMLPVNLLTVAIALVLPPWPAVITTYIGAMLAATIAFYVAKKGGQGLLPLKLRRRTEILKNKYFVKSKGVLAVATLRLIPLGPYTVFNLACGTFNIRFRDFFWGTFLGLLPGKIITFFFAKTWQTWG